MFCIRGRIRIRNTALVENVISVQGEMMKNLSEMYMEDTSEKGAFDNIKLIWLVYVSDAYLGGKGRGREYPPPPQICWLNFPTPRICQKEGKERKFA